jgi:hypothetical protein
MSWIKDNKFIVALGGGTLAGAILLFFVGSQGAGRYAQAKEKFDAAAAEVVGYESTELYPQPANRDAKRKALEGYRQSVESLQAAFAPFQPKEITNITPQEFTTRLLAAKTEVRKAFEDADATVPEAFFVGFENYKTALAPAKTTGVLDYQLGAIKNLLLELAKAKPAGLKNLHRPALPEEEGKEYTPSATAAARPFPLEITFVGPEKSAREFLSSITKPENQFVVIRSLRVTNEKKDPPRTADAKFDKPAPSKAASAADVFGGGFVLPGDDAAAPAADPAAATEPEAPKAADSSRILAQVLGNEQVQVFLRLDVLQFLPAKKLP